MLIKRRIPNRLWLSTPLNPSFTQGIAGSYNVAPHLRDNAIGKFLGLAELSNPLQAGVTIDDTNRRVLYDGAGAAAIANGVRLQLSDFAPPDTNFIEAQWLARSRGAGVFYANNFSEKRASNGSFTQTPYSNTAALRAASFTTDNSVAGIREVNLNTDPLRALSGGRSLELKTYNTNTAANGGNWMDRYKADNTPVNGFYFQIAVFMQRASLAWVLPQTSGQMKVCNLEQFGNGQVVIGAARNLGFPTLLINGNGLMERSFDSTPYRPTSGDFFYQTAIDSGSSLAAGTFQAYIRRYGPSFTIFNNLQDYGYKSSASTGGDPNLNLMYNRGFAWPNADALLAGAIPWNFDGWTVLEVYVNNTDFAGFVEPFDVCKMAVAAYGQAPVLTHDLAALPNDDPQSLGAAVGAYQTFETLWYDTAFEGATQDVGYRPTQQRWYAEIIGSTQPIPFPGGFAFP